MKYIVLFLSINCFTYTFISAQTPSPNLRSLKVGDQVPEILIRGIENYTKKNVKFSEFKGKFLLLDFWASNCVSCFSGFKKLTGLQKQFEKDFQAIIVNPYETKEEARERMSSPIIADRAILPNLPSIIGDKRWDTLFPSPTLGQQVWIDRDGRVMAISGSHNTNAETINKLLLTGRMDILTTPSFLIDLKKNRLRDNIMSNVKEQTNYSIFSHFYAGDGASISGMESGRVVDSVRSTVRYSFINTSFLTLFIKALNMMPHSKASDAFSRQTVYELSNPNFFLKPEANHEIDNYYRRNNFCYEIELPLIEETLLPSIMWRDLNQYIGNAIGIHARLEKRARLTRILRIEDSTKLSISKGGKSFTRYPNIKKGETTIGFFNMPIVTVLKDISNMLMMERNILRVAEGFIPLPTLVEAKTLVNIDLEIPNARMPQRDFLKEIIGRLNDIGVKVEEEYRDTELLILYDK